MLKTNFFSKRCGFSQASHTPHSNSQFSGTHNQNNNFVDSETYQICGKKGHSTLKFWYQFNQCLQLDDTLQGLAAKTLNDASHDVDWIADTSTFVDR